MRDYHKFILVISINHDIVELYRYWARAAAAGVVVMEGIAAASSVAVGGADGGHCVGGGGIDLSGPADELQAGQG